MRNGDGLGRHAGHDLHVHGDQPRRFADCDGHGEARRHGTGRHLPGQSPRTRSARSGATLTASVADLTSGAPLDHRLGRGSDDRRRRRLGRAHRGRQRRQQSARSRCSYLVGYGFAPPAGFLSPAPNSKWKTGQTVPIKIQLTGAKASCSATPRRTRWSPPSGCRLQFSATGAQSLARVLHEVRRRLEAVPVQLEARHEGHRNARRSSSPSPIPGTTQTTTRSESITITT